MTILELNEVGKDYPVKGGFLRRARGTLRAVDRVSLRVEAGETLGLVGESGSGKTTVGKLALRLLQPTRGRISFLGQPIEDISERVLRPLRAEMSMIFQDPYASLNPRRRVGRILARPFELHRRSSPAEVTRSVLDLLERVGLAPATDFFRKFPHQLSGGQRQRVAIARAVALRPKLVVADEPVASLDVSVRAQILNLLQDLKSDLGVSYLFISHDLSVVHSVSERVAVMYRGQIVEEGIASTLFLRPAHPYTQLLVASTPELLRRKAIQVRIGVVAADDVEQGACRFADRCPYVMARCRATEPALLDAGPAHRARCFLLEESAPPQSWIAARSWAGQAEPSAPLAFQLEEEG